MPAAHLAEAVTAGSLVSSGWVFAMDSTISYDDVALTMASSHYCWASSPIVWRP